MMKSLTLALMAGVCFGSAAWSQENDALQLNVITINGSGGGERVGGEIENYRATRSVSATKTDTPLKQVPQSVVVLPKEAIEDAGYDNIEPILDYAGVGKGNNFVGSLSGYNLRGFASSSFYLNGFPIGNGYTLAPDTSYVDRIDVLKGPSSLIFGKGDPSGLFNILTKQPEETASYTLGAQFGSYKSARTTLDATGPLNKDKTLLYRLNAAWDSSETFRDFGDTKRYVVAPVVSWKPNADTKITFEANLVRGTAPLDRGVPMYQGQIAMTSDSFSINEPGLDFLTKNTQLQLRFDHNLNDDWSVNGGIQYVNGSTRGYAAESRSLKSDGRKLVRQYSYRVNSWHSLNAQLNVVGKFNTGAFDHKLLAGVEFEHAYTRIHKFQSNTSSYPLVLDILDPQYGQALPPLISQPVSYGKSDTYSAFIQDQVGITDRLKLIGGVRVDNYINKATEDEETTTAFTPRIGATYELTPWASPFVIYSQSFSPNNGTDANGDTFDPETGKAYEAGVKFDLLDDRLSASVAYFHIDKENVLTTNPDDSDYNIAAGKVRSRGFDIGISGALTDNIRLMGNYSYVDAEVVEDSTLKEGASLSNVPRNRAAVMAMYDFKSGVLDGLGLGVGVNYVGSRQSSSSTKAFTMKEYTTVDLLGYYNVNDNLRFNFGVKNVFDKHYYDRPWSDTFAYPGTPLSFQIGVTSKFF